MRFPDRSSFLEAAKTHNLLVVGSVRRADYDTPLSLFRKIGGEFLLESVEHDGQVGRYSIITRGRLLTFTFSGNDLEIRGEWGGKSLSEKQNLPNPLVAVRQWLASVHCHAPEACPPFHGGLLGYLGYETVSYFEKIPTVKEGALVPDGILVAPRTVLVYDNLRRSVHCLELVEPGNKVEEAYTTALRRLDALETSLDTPIREIKEPFSDPDPAIKSGWGQSAYETGVEKLRQSIGAGEIIQAVLSQRFQTHTRASAFELYRSLRIANPSPYLFLLDFGEFQLVGSSPEVMVKLKDGELLLKPIAGTRRRGATPSEDEALAKDLLADAKERAEHLMLVDLGRNDLGRVSEPGSVVVSDFMSVERYSHVMHIVSTVRSRIARGFDAFDVIRSVFPAGTLSGAPKIRAMELLAELEPVRRGPYGGMVLNLGFGGNLDSCITIRTLLLKDGVATIQVGAGIVADSLPHLEHEETMNKSRALFLAIEETRQRNAP